TQKYFLVARNIPRSGQNPKILGRDDTEVIRYLITIDVPFSGHLLTQKGEDRRFEVGECLMTSVVGDMLVHQAPKPLDRIQMRAIGGNEVEVYPALRSCQPSLHQFGVVVAGIVQKQMDQPLAWIHRLDRDQ